MVILREQRLNKKEIDGIADFETSYLKSPQVDIGIAVDIGTTTIAMAAVDFEKRKVIGQLSEINEQTRLGADVMMRIMHAKRGMADKLHQMAVCQIERMAEQILSACQKETEDKRVCFSVVGNTTMCHLFLNQNVEGLAGYPFEPAYRGNYRCTGREVGMERFGESEVYVLSGIASHIGSDALAVIGAVKLWQKDAVQLAVDLGTNAEIILNNRGKISVCSAAAGPALEGRGIRYGMPAAPGVITGIKFLRGNGNRIIEYIPGDEIKGICGSGLVELLAELRRCKLLQEDGYLLSKEEAEKRGIQKAFCEQLVIREEEHAFLLYSDSSGEKEIYLLQSDIRSVQLAKGAIQTGILALLETAGLELKKVDEVYVSGVLGSCVNPKSAIRIGMLPDAMAAVYFVGNAAGKGAAAILTQENFFEEMEKLAQKISHIELANLPKFQSLFLEAMELKKWN